MCSTLTLLYGKSNVGKSYLVASMLLSLLIERREFLGMQPTDAAKLWKPVILWTDPGSDEEYGERICGHLPDGVDVDVPTCARRPSARWPPENAQHGGLSHRTGHLPFVAPGAKKCSGCALQDEYACQQVQILSARHELSQVRGYFRPSCDETVQFSSDSQPSLTSTCQPYPELTLAHLVTPYEARLHQTGSL